MRRGPADGYDFGPKRQYRRDIWSSFARLVREPANATVLLMPSLEGDEITSALRWGFTETNLHIVDFNPAVVATLKRRFKRINTYGVSLGRAVARIAEQGISLDAANLDMTSCVSSPLEAELRAFAAANCLKAKAVVAVTLLRGREVADYTTAIQQSTQWAQASHFDATLASSLVGDRELTPHDVGRFGWVLSRIATGRYCRGIKLGIYRSTSNQTMLWGVADTFEGEEWSVTHRRLHAVIEKNQAAVKQMDAALDPPSMRRLRRRFARGDDLLAENRRCLAECKELLEYTYVVADLFKGRESSEDEHE